MAKLSERLIEFARLAVESEAESGIPAEMICAQWAVESNWGLLVTGKNNYFGIKKAARHASGTWCKTREIFKSIEAMNAAVGSGQIRDAKLKSNKPGAIEVMCMAEFADYPTQLEAVNDIARLITMPDGPYKAGWTKFCLNHDAEQLMRDIASTYATGPGYADLCVRIMRQANVQAACLRGRKDDSIHT